MESGSIFGSLLIGSWMLILGFAGSVSPLGANMSHREPE
jgi:hypothetical protein